MISSSTSHKWLSIFAECAVLMYWLSRVWSRQGYSSASLCQTEVQRCLVWLHSLFDQAVSGIQIFSLCSYPLSWLLSHWSKSHWFAQWYSFVIQVLYQQHDTHDHRLPLQSSNNIFFLFLFFDWEQWEFSLTPLTFFCLLSDFNPSLKVTLIHPHKSVRVVADLCEVQRGYQNTPHHHN